MSSTATDEQRYSDDVIDLRVDYESEPINIDPSRPRFSWRVQRSRRGRKQTAYQILVAESATAIENRRGDCWDSGKVSASQSTNVTYDGIPLSSGTDYYWTVRVWDEDGERSPWAETASFSTALVSRHEWAGEWIGYQPDGGDSNGYRSRWHAGGSDAREWIEIDLEAVRSLDQIELFPTNPFDGPKTPDGMAVSDLYSADEEATGGAGGFGFPNRYRVEVATEPGFEDARTVADHTDEDRANPGTDPVAFDVDVAARYVRITATDLYEFDPADPPNEQWRQTKTDVVREEHRPWQTFALAAVAVRDEDGCDVATDCPVTASSSVEERTWGRDHLVNGRYESTAVADSPLLRSDVDLEKPVERARIHVCTLGYGELYLNGRRIGDDVLNPGWTQYDERALYSTYDVSDHLTEGRNTLGIWLGNGWFGKNRRDWTGFGSPRAILQLNVEYTDGTTRAVSTDGTWQATSSPITSNDIYDGERYDARREQPGWARPEFDGADEWESASIVDEPGGDLVPQRTPPIRVTETLEPVELVAHDEGTIVDFGQNLVGWVELTVDGADEGDEITIKHAETRLEDGSLALDDLRSADATDTYVSAGGETETYHPRFTYHGFRYAQIDGYPGDVDLEDVRARVVHTDVEPIGTFDCSNEELTQVQRNARWGLRGNIHSVVTDCPQRDERFGWTGDNHIAARSLLFNFDSALFYEKWMDDHADVRSRHGYIADTIPFGYGTIPEDPTWGITQVTIPWHLYRQYGDVDVLERHYGGMRRYVDFWYSVSDDGLISEEYGNYGDWLAFENTDGPRGLPLDLFNTAFQYHTTNLLRKIAGVLGNEADAERYADRADRIASTFNNEFFDRDASRYGPGTQASYAVPLYVGLVPDEHVDAVADRLAEKVESDGEKLQTGFLGTRPLIHTLVEHGYPELAYEVVSQPDRPGWVYMVRQGATTTWERWDSDDRIGDGMNSFNHSPFNFVSEWFYEALAGLRFDESMHEASVEIAPTVVDDLDWATGTLETVNGRLGSTWERTDDGLRLEVEIPWNTDATIRIPGDASEIRVEEDDELIWDGSTPASTPTGIESVRSVDGTVAVTTGSGTFRFDVVR